MERPTSTTEDVKTILWAILFTAGLLVAINFL